ncbi:MAG: SDR family oxidoreductase [Gemmatimonadaceae bacterium]|nr:SDR family oxidoreductase [Gemmatimonadaceae bacterium]MCW5826723.1 SDR family oxidoreductase [Gemmatimonadaceae bacterium]
MTAKRILITGATGYVGRIVGARLAQEHHVVGTDLRVVSDLGFETLAMDVRDPALATLLTDRGITHVVHLASVLEGRGDRAVAYDIDVQGTKNVVDSALAAGVRHLTVASSGAAYGYFADNPDWIDEDFPLRAGFAFAYAHHKRLVEELLAGYRATHPELAQLVLRIGTVLGAGTQNQITALFQKRRILAVRGSDSRFVFIWDEDVAGAVAHGVAGDRTGIYNVAGDGALTIHEIAAQLGKRTLVLPAFVLQQALEIGQFFHLSRYGPEQLDFLRYRPVLSNRRLKDVFGYRPAKTSGEAFTVWAQAQRHR